MATSTGSLPWAVAPQRSASASRSGRGSRTHTASTPVAWAAAMWSRPLAPAPTTSTASPGATPVRRWARRAQPSGSVNVASTGVHAVEREQLLDELCLHAHVLREAAGVQPSGAEALAEGLVAAAATPAFAAGRVMVDGDAVARTHRGDAGADLDDLARRLVAEHRGELAAHVEGLDVGAAGRAGEHAAHHLARPAPGVGRLLDDRLRLAERARDPHATAATVAVVTGRATPFSVTSAHTSSAGVTSNAG